MAEEFDLGRDAEEIIENIKTAVWLPVKTGFMRDNAINGSWDKLNSNEQVYLIKFDSSIAPYIKYLEEGTIRKQKNNNVSFMKMGSTMNRFGVPFHVGSGAIQASPVRTGKHMGFISDKTISLILDYFVVKYKGEIVKWI